MNEKYLTNVFINCPFDEEFAPLLQAMLFCVVYLGLSPRLATENIDGTENRLANIVKLIGLSKYSIHDLSRCISKKEGEVFRLNMPFELGIDYGCREYSDGIHKLKRMLVLEETQYSTKAALSDIAGCDVQFHSNNSDRIIRNVRNWLVSEAGAEQVGASAIKGKYIEFQEWHYEKQLLLGFSEEDIQDYPTAELLVAMKEWVQLNGA